MVLSRLAIAALVLMAHDAVASSDASEWDAMLQPVVKNEVVRVNSVNLTRSSNAIYSEGTLYAHLGDASNRADFYGLPVMDISQLPSDQSNIMQHNKGERSVLVLAPPFRTNTWHHLLFDGLMPPLRLLEALGMLDLHGITLGETTCVRGCANKPHT